MAEPRPKRLRDLKNIGKAMLADFELLGVESVDQLAGCDPNELYDRLQEVTGHRHDPCVLDTFMAVVHEARTGERLNWWAFTSARKAAARAAS
jgi:hypothetical protein